MSDEAIIVLKKEEEEKEVEVEVEVEVEEEKQVEEEKEKKEEVEKTQEIDQYLKTLAQTGEKRHVATSIFSDEDIRQFLFYRSKVLQTPELSLEMQYLIFNPICSKLNDTEHISSVIQYDKALPQEKTLLASWYSGENETDAFRRTKTHYIIAQKKPIHGLVCFKDPSVCQTQFVYVYVCGRFASPTEEHTPIYWAPARLFCTSLRDLCLYVLPNEELKNLGIDITAEST